MKKPYAHLSATQRGDMAESKSRIMSIHASLHEVVSAFDLLGVCCSLKELPLDQSSLSEEDRLRMLALMVTDEHRQICVVLSDISDSPGPPNGPAKAVGRESLLLAHLLGAVYDFMLWGDWTGAWRECLRASEHTALIVRSTREYQQAVGGR